MKSYNEMADSVFQRIKKYEEEKKKRTYAVISISCICIIVMLGGILGILYINNNKSVSVSESSEKTPMKIIHMIHIGDKPAEFAGDMHRPEGYNINIGSALALKMSITEDKDYKYSVVFDTFDGWTLEQIAEITNIKFDEVMLVNDTIAGENHSIYYSLLTAEQIFNIAENGITCRYVGSGKGEHNNIDWESKEGINTFCELRGDMMFFSDESRTKIICTPDLISSDEIEKYTYSNNQYSNEMEMETPSRVVPYQKKSTPRATLPSKMVSQVELIF